MTDLNECIDDNDDSFEKVEHKEKNKEMDGNTIFFKVLDKLSTRLIETSEWKERKLLRYSILSKNKYLKAFFKEYIINMRDLNRKKEGVLERTIDNISKNINIVEKEKASSITDFFESLRRK